jgi:hypothetical protein
MDHCAKIATGMIMIPAVRMTIAVGKGMTGRGPARAPGPRPVLGPCEPAARKGRSRAVWVVPSLKLLS